MKFSHGVALTLLSMCSIAFADENTAPVSGFARSFIYDKPITNATITIMETGQEIQTDDTGHFGPIQYPVGKPITLTLSKFGFKTTQSATVVVPPEGLTGPYDNIALQIPPIEIYFLLQNIIGAKEDSNSCHLASTITAYHKTVEDVPQGEVNSKVTISPAVSQVPYYFGIFESGPLQGRTNPFTKDLTATSADGGLLFYNLPPRDEPYTLSAEKAGVTFSKVQFMCKKGVFINASPPRGPSAQK